MSFVGIFRALLPTDAEAPKLNKNNEDKSKETDQTENNENSPSNPSEVNNNEKETKGADEAGDPADEKVEEEVQEEADKGDLLVEPAFPDGRRVSNVDAQYCNGFKPTSRACVVL